MPDSLLTLTWWQMVSTELAELCGFSEPTGRHLGEAFEISVLFIDMQWGAVGALPPSSLWPAAPSPATPQLPRSPKSCPLPVGTPSLPGGGSVALDWWTLGHRRWAPASRWVSAVVQLLSHRLPEAWGWRPLSWGHISACFHPRTCFPPLFLPSSLCQ